MSRKHFTTYVRVEKWKALQVEIHPVPSLDTCLPWWFEDRHLQEVLQLLKVPIFERVRLKKQEINKNMKQSEILTGPSVRIGYVFRSKPEYQICLLPGSQSLDSNDTEDRDSAHTCPYRDLRLHHEKLVIYVCLSESASEHGAMSQILSAMSENSQQAKKVGISSYFSRVIPPESQSASSDSNIEGITSAVHGDKGDNPVPLSESRKRKLKSIIKRSGPRLSRKAKKVKSAVELLPTLRSTVETSEYSQEDKENNITSGDIIHDEFPKPSVGHKSDVDDVSSVPCESLSPEIKCEKKFHFMDLRVDKGSLRANLEMYTNVESRSDNKMSCCQEKIEDDCQRKKHESSNKSDQNVHIGKEGNINSTGDVQTMRHPGEMKDCTAGQVSISPRISPSISDSISPLRDLFEDSFTDCHRSKEEKSDPHKLDDFKHPLPCQDDLPTVSFRPSKRIFRAKRPTKVVGSDVSLSSNQDREAKTLDTVKGEGRYETPAGCEDVGREGHNDDDALPKIALKKRDRSWRRSLALMVNAGSPPERVQGEEEVVDCAMISSEFSEDLQHLPGQTMMLSRRLKEQLKEIRSEKDLTEFHIEMMVLGSKSYLLSIFTGKLHCQRHQDYKMGGLARYGLNFQMNLGMFTEPQQDAVMEILMSIFCKKHHKYMDYILKVLLPEMLILIVMEVRHISHEETERLMSRGAL